MYLHVVQNHHSKLTCHLRSQSERPSLGAHYRRRLLTAISFVILTFLITICAHIMLSLAGLILG